LNKKTPRKRGFFIVFSSMEVMKFWAS